MWKFLPSDSALFAQDIFKQSNIRKILIPGCGYGRNAKLFYDEGFDVTGIEISQSAIELGKRNGLLYPVFYGSVTQMPFDDTIYDGIFCYALIHLLNQRERYRFLQNCINQLSSDGIMIFMVVSKKSDLYGRGKLLAKDRFLVSRGLPVFFYDETAVEREFGKYGLLEYREIEEPVKFQDGFPPLKCYFIVCRKQ